MRPPLSIGETSLSLLERHRGISPRMSGVNRQRLRELLLAAGKSAREVSRDARLGDTAVRDILNGKSREPGFATLAAIAKALNVDIAEIFDHPSADPAGLRHFLVAPKFLPVRYRVQAGAWVEIDAEEALLPVSIAVVPDPRYSAWPQWLELVVGDSANLKIPPGHYAHVVDAIDMGYAPQDGHWVIVERRRGATRERTIKQVSIAEDGKVTLWPRSTNPRWKEPLSLTGGSADGEEIEVEIVGKVIGSYDPDYD